MSAEGAGAPPRRYVPPAPLASAGLADFTGRVRLTRSFGYPGKLDEREHVWLTFDAITGSADITVNGVVVASRQTGACEFEITSILAARNRLQIELDAASESAGLTGEVAMEIRRDAFLRGVVAWAVPDGSVHVHGLVMGTCATPLELYALADGQHVHYSTITPSPAGQPFDFAFSPDTVPQQVRVELVWIAECWYAVLAPVASRRP